MSYEVSQDLNVRLEGSVLHVTLSRPEKRNALTDDMVAGLLNVCSEANMDEAVRALLLDADGDNFCVGSDIVARNAGHQRPRTGSIQRRLPGHAHRLIPVLRNLQVPIVCAVQGWVVGLGLALALAADFLVVSDDATIWAPFAERGITPDSGVAWMLPRRVGTLRAREMLLLGRKVDPETALNWGLAYAVSERADLLSAATKLSEQLASGPTVATGLTKWLINSGEEVALESHLRNEAFSMELSSRSLDFREGFAAFRERRSPGFSGL